MTPTNISLPVSPASRLSRILAEADSTGQPFDPAALLSLDEREEFPSAACALLDDFGLTRHYLPRTEGGLLDDFFELIRLVATVARKDLTVAVAHAKTFLGVAPVWVAGSPAQRQRMAAELADGTVVSWGLTERGHGSDLLAGELRATRDPDGSWRLDGSKWMINNATRGDAICVLARTSDTGGTGDFNLFLVDKRVVPDDRYTHLPKLPTYGIRGADISGITFHDLEVPADSLVGQEGSGITTVLKALQLTRIATIGLSWGAVQHTLDVLRTLRPGGIGDTGGFPVDDCRYQRILGRAITAARVVEAMATVATRSVHSLPDELSVISSIAKSVVPTLVDGILLEVSEIIGDLAGRPDSSAAREYRKLERDHRIVGIFDGSTVVNQQALIAQFPTLARSYAARAVNHDGLAFAVGLHEQPPPFRVDRLALVSRNGCSLVQAIPETVARIVELAASSGLTPACVRLVERAEKMTEDVVRAVSEYRPQRQTPRRAFELAEAYEFCFAAAACMRFWLAHAGSLNGTWLHAALALVIYRGDGARGEDTVFDEVTRQAMRTGDRFPGTVREDSA